MAQTYKVLLCILLLTYSSKLAIGQEESILNSHKVIQLSGQIKFEDQTTPIEGVQIYIKNKDRGTISNYNGVFSIAMNTSDTLIFRALGLKTIEKTLHPQALTNNFHYMEVIMKQDTFYLNPIVISLLPEGLAFDYYFSQLEEYSPSEVHKKSLNPQAIQKMSKQLPYQNMEVQIYTQQEMHRLRGWDGMKPSGQIYRRRF